jgi:hypothetical protein
MLRLVLVPFLSRIVSFQILLFYIAYYIGKYLFPPLVCYKYLILYKYIYILLFTTKTTASHFITDIISLLLTLFY